MTPETIIRDEEPRSSAEIESEIRQTRSRMDATLDELGNRLTPRSLINTALDWWETPEPGGRGNVAVKKAASALAKQAREHPMPAILIGSGLAWLVADAMEHDEDEEVGSRKSSRNRRRVRVVGRSSEGRTASEPVDQGPGKIEKAKQAAASVKEKASAMTGKMHQTTEKISDQAHEALELGKDSALKMRSGVQRGYEISSARFQQACKEYPMAVGLGFAALGALVGLLIPRTRREDEMMGEKSDLIIQETKEKAEELLESSKVVGSRVIETVKNEAKAQGLTGDSVSDTMSALVDKGTQIAQKARDEAMHAAEEEGLVPNPEKAEHEQKERVPEPVGSGSNY